MILKISKAITYYVVLEKGYQNHFRTNSDGTFWEALYGDSWEPEYNMEPAIVNEFLAYLEFKETADKTYL